MKKILLIFAGLIAVSTLCQAAKLPPLEFTSGHELTLINKLLPTPDRYARVDTTKYDGFTDYQRRKLVQESAGLALVFETNSDCVFANIRYKLKGHSYNATDLNNAGLDLYIRDAQGKWLYAGNNVPRNQQDETFEIVKNMKPGNKECLLYLPAFSIVDSVNIGVTPGCYVRPIENPFRHRVMFFGSSFTHGASAARPGTAYPLLFERTTGLHTPALGMSGNSKLQQSYARVLADTPADAFIFDAFSNPSAREIHENFGPFLKTIREKHPTTPIIFMQTIYRERRNFDTKVDEFERAKMEAACEEVENAMKTDPNVFFIVPDAVVDHEETTDGTHPSDLGYHRWLESISPRILEILSGYGIK